MNAGVSVFSGHSLSFFYFYVPPVIWEMRAEDGELLTSRLTDRQAFLDSWRMPVRQPSVTQH